MATPWWDYINLARDINYIGIRNKKSIQQLIQLGIPVFDRKGRKFNRKVFRSKGIKYIKRQHLTTMGRLFYAVNDSTS